APRAPPPALVGLADADAVRADVVGQRRRDVPALHGLDLGPVGRVRVQALIPAAPLAPVPLVAFLVVAAQPVKQSHRGLPSTGKRAIAGSPPPARYRPGRRPAQPRRPSRDPLGDGDLARDRLPGAAPAALEAERAVAGAVLGVGAARLGGERLHEVAVARADVLIPLGLVGLDEAADLAARAEADDDDPGTCPPAEQIGCAERRGAPRDADHRDRAHVAPQAERLLVRLGDLA